MHQRRMILHGGKRKESKGKEEQSYFCHITDKYILKRHQQREAYDEKWFETNHKPQEHYVEALSTHTELY